MNLLASSEEDHVSESAEMAPKGRMLESVDLLGPVSVA